MSMKLRRATAAASVIVTALAALVVGGPASAATGPSCGDVISVDTVLTADLVCDGSTDGLIVGAADITLDLGGYTIAGPGRAATSHAAVRVARLEGVTVTRGTVT